MPLITIPRMSVNGRTFASCGGKSSLLTKYRTFPYTCQALTSLGDGLFLLASCLSLAKSAFQALKMASLAVSG